MRKKLFATLTVLSIGFLSSAQTSEECHFGTVSEETSNGGNISTGGLYEYSIASDFDVPFGIEFSVEQIKFNVLKGTADLDYVNLYFLEEFQGKPGTAIHTFENQIPVAQELVYTTEIPDIDAYQITIDLPSAINLPKGKYYLQLQAAPGDEFAASWELVNQETTTLGRFDFSKFEDEDWFGGFAYYDHVFEVSGVCTTVEEMPNYGEACNQANESNDYETGINLPGASVADDFIVEENTTFFLSTLKISTLQLGNIKNATIKIRNSENGSPGDEIYTVENIGPKTENFFGYHPFAGFPLDVVAVDLEFEFDEPIELTQGNYFIEVQATPFPYTDILTWEATSLPGIGSNAYSSNDDGQTWVEVTDYNLVFDVSGYCLETLGTDNLETNMFSYFPNPVLNEINIKTNSEIKNTTIYNAIGQLVFQTSNNSKTINIASLPSGIYFVKTELKDRTIEVFKIIKQ